jgi:predicted RNA-binding protein with PIN domain
LLDNDNNDNTSKKVFDYNINENQFAIEYTAIFEDGTSDSYIENKIIKRTTAERLPIWVEYIKKKEEKYKKRKIKQIIVNFYIK